jgi:hypothetical protein
MLDEKKKQFGVRTTSEGNAVTLRLVSIIIRGLDLANGLRFGDFSWPHHSSGSI